MRGPWFAACALLGLVGCRDDAPEALGAARRPLQEHPIDPAAGAPAPGWSEPIDPSTIEQGLRSQGLVCLPALLSEPPADTGRPRSATPPSNEPSTPRPRPEDFKPDEAPKSPLPTTTPPDMTSPPTVPSPEPPKNFPGPGPLP